MASVPNNTGTGTEANWSLKTVRAAVGIGLTNLVSMFSSASSLAFDSNYSGSKDELLNFRNYNATPIGVTAGEGRPTAATACGSGDITYTFFFLNNAVIDSATVFTDASLSTIFTTSNGGYFFRLDAQAGGPITQTSTVQISAAGTVMDPRAVCPV